MKNLGKASDEDIYRMKGMLETIVMGFPRNKTVKKCLKQVKKEWSKRDFGYVPLSWDLCPPRKKVTNET